MIAQEEELETRVKIFHGLKDLSKKVPKRMKPRLKKKAMDDRRAPRIVAEGATRIWADVL